MEPEESCRLDKSDSDLNLRSDKYLISNEAFRWIRIPSPPSSSLIHLIHLSM